VTGVGGRYSIVGFGETAYTRDGSRSTRALGVEAVRRAAHDAGLLPTDIDGMVSYHASDSTSSEAIAQDLGMRLNFYLDSHGGGTSPETLVGVAAGAIEAGMCHTVAIFRAMNGYTGVRIGGNRPPGSVAPPAPRSRSLGGLPYGPRSGAELFQFAFTRHMHEYGTTNEQLAQVKVVQSRHASNNPKACYPNRVTVDDVLNSRWVVKPACHLLDCCIETDSATCILVTSRERALDLRQPPVTILSAVGRVTRPFPEMYYQCDPINRQAGYYARRAAFGQAGVGPDDIDLTGAYDAFTFTPLLLFEAYGFCAPGEGGQYASSGVTELGGARPNNTSGGQLCEGYTHGLNLVIENVRQLRHRADDSCLGWKDGEHSFDYREGGCRQVRNAEVAMNLGWGTPALTSALILGRSG
jgi:acetyl-CoA acetyltransferase